MFYVRKEWRSCHWKQYIWKQYKQLASERKVMKGTVSVNHTRSRSRRYTVACLDILSYDVLAINLQLKYYRNYHHYQRNRPWTTYISGEYVHVLKCWESLMGKYRLRPFPTFVGLVLSGCSQWSDAAKNLNISLLFGIVRFLMLLAKKLEVT